MAAAGRSRWWSWRAPCRPCSRTCRGGASPSASWRHIRRRSRTSSSHSPGGSCAMSDVLGTASWREPMMRDATSVRPRSTDRSLAQLTFVRFKEFLREPEAVFWTFAFPVILALGLGIAFRNKPADVLVVGVVGGTPAGDSLAAALAATSGFRVKVMPEDSAARALRTGELALVAAATGAGHVEYRFDDTRPEGRSARAAADDALQRAAGRRDPVAVSDA